MNRFRTSFAAAALSTVMLSAAFTGLAAQERHFTGGAVEGTQVRTNPAAIQYFEFPGTPVKYMLLGSSSLTVHVDPGDDDLFVFEFNAICRLVGSYGTGDSVTVQARLNGFFGAPLGGGPFLQPQGSANSLKLCGIEAPQAVSKSWAVRLTGGASGTDWTFSVWWRPTRVDSNIPLGAVLNDRVVRLTRFN